MNLTATCTNPVLVSRAEALKPTGTTFAFCGSWRAN